MLVFDHPGTNEAYSLASIRQKPYLHRCPASRNSATLALLNADVFQSWTLVSLWGYNGLNLASRIWMSNRVRQMSLYQIFPLATQCKSQI
jgi:hypothetical protein